MPIALTTLVPYDRQHSIDQCLTLRAPLLLGVPPPIVGLAAAVRRKRVGLCDYPASVAGGAAPHQLDLVALHHLLKPDAAGRTTVQALLRLFQGEPTWQIATHMT